MSLPEILDGVKQVGTFLWENKEMILGALGTLSAVVIYILKLRKDIRDAWNEGKAHEEVAKVVTGVLETSYQEAKATVASPDASKETKVAASTVLDAMVKIKEGVRGKIDANPNSPPAVFDALKKALGK